MDISFPDDLPLADPGLLASFFADPDPQRKFAVGFIPHFREQETEEVKSVLNSNKEIHFIDITQSPRDVIREIQQCESIVSSSLHGLVFSDSLVIPNVFVRLTELPKGGTFKYRDYYSSFGIDTEPIRVEDVFGLTPEIIKHNYKIEEKDVEEKKRQLISTFPDLS